MAFGGRLRIGGLSDLSSPSGSEDVSPDGTQFLMLMQEDAAAGPEILIVQNWFDELQRLVPSP